MSELSESYELWVKVMQDAGLSYGPADTLIAHLEEENAALGKTRIDLCVMLKEWMAFIHKERLGELHRETNEILERNMSGKETPCP